MLSVLRPPRGEEHLLTDALRRVGAKVVCRAGERVEGYIPLPRNVGELLAEARMALRAGTSLADPGLRWRVEGPARLRELWRAESAPRSVGERFRVIPALDASEAPGTHAGSRDLSIRLLPGPAFGTAGHPSTRSCIARLERLVVGGERILDVGTGSGILAIAAIHLGAERVVATEVDTLALAHARQNAELNDVLDRIDLRHVRSGPEGLDEVGSVAGAVANLESPALLPILTGIASATVRDGWVVLAGIPRVDREEVVEAARAAGLSPREEEVVEGWWAGVFGRGS